MCSLLPCSAGSAGLSPNGHGGHGANGGPIYDTINDAGSSSNGSEGHHSGDSGLTLSQGNGNGHSNAAAANTFGTPIPVAPPLPPSNGYSQARSFIQ